jgi:hypothetical protein
MKLAIALAAALIAIPCAASDTYIKPYVKKDGTYVPGHYQTKPNETKVDNYSSKPNVNPYTGKTGTVDPYKVPEYKAPEPYDYGLDKPKKKKY